MSTRPSTSHSANTSSVPLIKSFRFSTSHDGALASPTSASATSSSGKRASRLQEYLGRSRTASLPPRPHTSGGAVSHKVPTALYAKEQEISEDSSHDSGASSSHSSAHPAASTSFVPYSPTTAASFQLQQSTSSRSHTSHTSVTASQTASPTSPASTNSHSTSLHAVSSGSSAAASKRRGSILHVASDALSRMNPIRTRSMGKQPMAGVRVTSPTPIVLTEVIEITESVVRATKRREEEDEERERLRDAAARALGIGDVEAEVASSHTRSHVEDEYAEREGYDGAEFGVREDDMGDQKTPVAPSHDTGLPPASTGNGNTSSQGTRHTRSRSGSFLPLALTSLSRSGPPKTPSLISQSSYPASSYPAPLTPNSVSANHKSHSTPPALTLMVPRRSSNGALRSPGGRAQPVSALPLTHGRPHAQSYSHTHDRAIPPPKIPPFPTTAASLAPFTQRAATVPRYYQAATLLMFALSKQWKNRYFVLTAPLSTPSSVTSPPLSPTSLNSSSTTSSAHAQAMLAPSYLHMFKSSASDERELERLEINEESVAYVADGEVGGRKSVVKFEGILRRRPIAASAPGGKEAWLHAEDGPAGGEEGRTTWIVQIVDAEETQKWIEAIKGAVLNQRSIRAGLGVGSSGAEPRGDLDVILSMRASGFSSMPMSPLQVADAPPSMSPVARAQGTLSPTQSNTYSEASRSSPTPSLTRSQSAALSAALNSYAMTSGANFPIVPEPMSPTSGTATPSRPSITAGAALKNLFAIGGGRPRSPSTSASVNPSLHSLSPDDYDEEQYANQSMNMNMESESFARAGSNLLNMLRNGSFSSERPMSPTHSVPPTPRVATPADHLLDRKILPDSDRHLVENEDPEPLTARPGKLGGLFVGPARDREGNFIVPGRVSSDMGSQSLQPPPRKRAGTVSSIAVSTSTEGASATMAYAHANGSTAESLGVNVKNTNGNLLSSSPPMPSSPIPGRPKDRRGRASWSSMSSFASNEHTASSSPEDARNRRWSKRASHPYRLSPPYGPPPATPPSSPQSRSTRVARHPYAAEGSPSRSSSVGSSSRSPETPSRPLSPKRESGGSVQSCSTVDTTQSRGTGLGGISLFSHGPRPRSSHRASMPPPPRPVPEGALPPTPGDDYAIPSSSPSRPLSSAPPSKSSFRESFAFRGQAVNFSHPSSGRASRASMDEPGRRSVSSSGHRRSSSIGSNSGQAGALYPIPASPTRVKSPFPPPNGPLPPTPPSPTPDPSASTTKRSSIKRRLRMLSSPPTSPPQTALPLIPSVSPSSPEPPNILLPPAHILAPPAPIGEPITTQQNDPDFLSMPTISPPRSPAPDTPVLAPNGFVSLPPPPRRSSRQAPSHDKAHLSQEIASSASLLLVVTNEDSTQSGKEDGVRPSPPPELDDIVSLLPPPALRSPDHCAVSLVDVSI